MLALCLASHCLPSALADEDAEVRVVSSNPGSDHKTGRKIVTRPILQDKMDRRNFHVVNPDSEGNLVDTDGDGDEASRTLGSYSYLTYSRLERLLGSVLEIATYSDLTMSLSIPKHQHC